MRDFLGRVRVRNDRDAGVFVGLECGSRIAGVFGAGLECGKMRNAGFFGAG